MLVVLA